MYRDAPLSESCNDALQQLIQITHAYAGDMPLEFCKISIKDGGFIDDYQKLTCIKEKMRSFDISQTPNFETHVSFYRPCLILYQCCRFSVYIGN